MKRDSKPRSPAVPAQWYRAHASELKDRCCDLKALEIGVLTRLHWEMHLRGEPLRNDPERLARLCGTTPAAFKKAAGILADKQLIELTREGEWWSPYMQREIDYRAEKSRVARENASKLSQKAKRYQEPDRAIADKSLESREEEGGGENPPPLHPSSSSSTADVDSHPTIRGRRRAPSGAPPRRYRVQEDIDVDGIGRCTVVSTSPTLIRLRSLDHGRYLSALLDQAGYLRADSVEYSDDDDDEEGTDAA